MPASVLESTPPGTARRNPSLLRRRVHTLKARLRRACTSRGVIMPTACFCKNWCWKKKPHTPRRLVGCCCSEMMRLLFVVCMHQTLQPHATATLLCSHSKTAQHSSKQSVACSQQMVAMPLPGYLSQRRRSAPALTGLLSRGF